MFESLGKIVSRRKKFWDKSKIEANQKILKEWEEQILKEFGPAMIPMAKPMLVRNQRLIISVRNAVIACEIQARKEKIKNAINKKISDKKSLVEEIVLRI